MNYLLLGPEEGEKNDFLRDEKKRILSEHPDAEIHQFYVGDDTGENVGSVLLQSSLFSSFRFVVIKQYENRSDRDGITAALIDFFKSGQRDAEVIIVSSEKSKNKIPQGILSGIGDSGIKIFWEMFENKKREWIVNAFRKEGFSIRPEAIEEILFSTENNTQDMKNLVNSLSLYFHATMPEKTAITVDDIEQYAIKTRGEDGYTLFAAIAEGNLEHAVLIMQTILESDSYGAIRAFSIISSRFRLLEAALEMKSKGISMDLIEKNAEYISPYPSSFREKGIRKRELPVMLKAMSNYTLSEVRTIITYLGRFDSELKSTPTELMMIVLTTMLHRIIIDKGQETPITIEPLPLTPEI